MHLTYFAYYTTPIKFISVPVLWCYTYQCLRLAIYINISVTIMILDQLCMQISCWEMPGKIFTRKVNENTKPSVIIIDMCFDIIMFSNSIIITFLQRCLWGVLYRNQVSRAFSLHEGDGGGRPSSMMSLGVASVGGHSHGHPASPIGVGSLWEDTNPRSPEPLVVRGGWLWLIWVVRWTT